MNVDVSVPIVKARLPLGFPIPLQAVLKLPGETHSVALPVVCDKTYPLVPVDPVESLMMGSVTVPEKTDGRLVAS